jgi:hypothetical protein
MPARNERQPVVDVRRRPRADGTVEEIPTVRYYDTRRSQAASAVP